MTTAKGVRARDKLIRVGTELLRRNGYSATSVDEVCAAAGVTKGAFFHHFAAKEDLAEACLAQWKQHMVDAVRHAPFLQATDPADRAIGLMDFFITYAEQPGTLKSCLAGTTVQEVAHSHPKLRAAAGACFAAGEAAFTAAFHAALKARHKRADAASLARLWMATLQGSFILCKAGENEKTIGANLRHVREYIRGLLRPRKGPA